MVLIRDPNKEDRQTEEILEASWRPLGSHVGPLEALKAKMLIFPWFYNGLAAQVARHPRKQASEPEPWRD